MKHKIMSKLFAFYKKLFHRKEAVHIEQKIIVPRNDGIIIIINKGEQ